jgi:hypothetical protein
LSQSFKDLFQNLDTLLLVSSMQVNTFCNRVKRFVVVENRN